jgi:hypothetical protein
MKEPSSKSAPVPPTQKPAAAAIRVARVLPNHEAPALAFGAGWLGQLTEAGVVLWDTAKLAKGKRVALKNPRGLGVLADGGLLAIGAPEPGSAKVVAITSTGASKSYPATMRTATEALSRVFAHPSGATAFSVLVPGAAVSLDSYKLELLEGELELLDSRKLPLTAPRSLIALSDHTLLFLDGPRLQPVDAAKGREAPAPAPLPLPADIGNPILLAPGPGRGQVYVATDPPALHLIGTEGGQVRPLSRTETGGRLVYSLDGAGEYCAAILVDQSSPQAAAWSLVVYGASGKELLRQELPFLPARPPVDPHSVRISAGGLVAVGNQRRLFVWDVKSGKQLLREGDASPRRP